MIQRVQTIYFFVASLLNGLTFLLPVFRVVEVANPENAKSFTLGSYAELGLPIFIVALIATVLPLVLIALYKNRPLQMRLGRVATVITLATVSLMMMAYGKAAPETTASEVAAAPGMFMPFGSILFLILAVRSVKKDEELVRSSERIR